MKGPRPQSCVSLSLFFVSFAALAAEPGEMTYVQTVRNAAKSSAAPAIKDLLHPTATAISPDGRNLYVTAENGGALLAFSREAATGAVTYIGVRKNGADRVARMTSPHALAIAPSGDRVIVASNAEATLTEFVLRPHTGEPLFRGRLAGGEGGVSGLDGVCALTFSPDGTELYALAHGGDAMSVFAFDQTGDLAFRQSLRQGTDGVGGLRTPRSLAVSPDGRHIYIASFLDDTLTLVERGPAGGLAARGPAIAGAAPVPPNPIAISISPDGAFVYLVSYKDNALRVYARDPVSGVLTQSAAVDAGTSGFDALFQPTAMVMSPDGRYVYLAGIGRHAVSSFARDPQSGGLSPRQRFAMGQPGIDGLNGPSALSLSPDIGGLYVLCRGDNSMAVFSIDSDGDGLSNGLDNDGVPDTAVGNGDSDGEGIANRDDPQAGPPN